MVFRIQTQASVGKSETEHLPLRGSGISIYAAFSSSITFILSVAKKGHWPLQPVALAFAWRLSPSDLLSLSLSLPTWFPSLCICECTLHGLLCEALYKTRISLSFRFITYWIKVLHDPSRNSFLTSVNDWKFMSHGFQNVCKRSEFECVAFKLIHVRAWN